MLYLTYIHIYIYIYVYVLTGLLPLLVRTVLARRSDLRPERVGVLAWRRWREGCLSSYSYLTTEIGIPDPNQSPRTSLDKCKIN